MSRAESSVAHDRAADVLARLLVEPTDALRAERSAMKYRLHRHRDPLLRRMLAEHYRSLGAPDQAARWGIVEPGWVTDGERRALRRTLLSDVHLDGMRHYLVLRSAARTPIEVADLLDDLPRHSNLPALVDWARFVTVLVVGGALIAWGIAVVSAIRSSIDGVAPLEAFREQRVQAFVAGMIALAGWLALRWSGPIARRATASWEQRRVERFETVSARIASSEERRLLASSHVRLAWSAEEQVAGRSVLVELARARGAAEEAGCWGAAVDGLTTVGERAAFAASLRTGHEGLRAFERRSMRREAPMGADERDVLVRASIPVPSDAYAAGAEQSAG